MNEPASLPAILRDPVWYITGAIFALLATLLPGVLGLSRLMPAVQTAALWLLLLPAIRRGALRPAAKMVGLWLAIQAMAVAAFAWLDPDRAELLIGDAFAYRTALLAWLYADAPLPAGWETQPLARAAEVLGVTVGSFVSGGLVGLWFLLRSLTLWAYGVGAAAAAASPLGGGGALVAAVGVLEPWWMARLAAFALLTVVLASPGFTGNYGYGSWPAGARRALHYGVALLLIGLLLELLFA